MTPSDDSIFLDLHVENLTLDLNASDFKEL